MQDSIEHYMQTVGQQARRASRLLSSASTSVKNHALSSIYTALADRQNEILAANAIDMKKAKNSILTAHYWIDWNLPPHALKECCKA